MISIFPSKNAIWLIAMPDSNSSQINNNNNHNPNSSWKLHAYLPKTPKDLRNSAPVVFLEVIGICGVLIAIYMFFHDLRDRQDDRIIRSWQLLSTYAPGSTGKARAMEYLNKEFCHFIPLDVWLLGQCWKEREDFSSLSSLSNRKKTTLKGKDENSDTHVEVIGDRVSLKGVQIPDAKLQSIQAHAADFSDANLRNADFTNSTLFETKFNNATLIGAKLANVDLENSNLTNAKLQSADLTGANISGADFTDAEISDETKLNCIWARSNNIPITDNKRILDSIEYCDVGKKFKDLKDTFKKSGQLCQIHTKSDESDC